MLSTENKCLFRADSDKCRAGLERNFVISPLSVSSENARCPALAVHFLDTRTGLVKLKADHVN